MTERDFVKWLDTVVVTKPLTLADARELYTMIKNMLPNAFVDVCWTRGDVMHVRVDDLRRDLEAR